MSSDPRVHKPRLPKAYSDQQLAFLKGSLPEFERRSQGSIRGDAKKFALERAQDFIVTFGLPDEFIGVEEAESRFKEQIYNWFKNTVGRTRRKLEGRPRSGGKKSDPKGKQPAQRSPPYPLPTLPQSSALGWSNSGPSANDPTTYEPSTTASPVNPSQSLISPIQYGGLQASSSMSTALSTPSTSHATAHPGPSAHGPQQQQQQQQQPAHSSHGPTAVHTHSATAHPPHTPAAHISNINLNVTKAHLRDAFLQLLDPSALANMVTAFSAANSSPTPLTPVVDALFDAICAESTPSGTFNRDPHPYLRRFIDASNFFPAGIVHAGVAGPLAGPRALQMQIRKYSTWTPTAPARPSGVGVSTITVSGVSVGTSRGSTSAASSSSLSLSDEMQRIAMDRQRRKDHIQWARIHAAALELGMLSMGRVGDSDNSGYAYAMGRAFSEMMARDAVWETDEVEWVAGICVLRAVIRTAMRGDRRQRDEYDELLRTYEGRWKEIKDEARQAVVTEVLLGAKEDLARLDESLS